MWLRDTGILEKVKKYVMNPPRHIPAPRVRFNQPLILRQFGIIMIIMIVGLFISITVFLVELLKTSNSVDAPRAGVGIEMTHAQTGVSSAPTPGVGVILTDLE